jgi:outer membrane receptor protein involved in Fe transport
VRLAQGFRAPETAELYRLQGAQEQANLDSEELKGIEIGGRGVVGDLQYELGLYYSEKNNVIFQDSERRNISGAKTLHYGLDATLRWQLASTVDLALDATVARHEYDSNPELLGVTGDIKGNQMDTAPEYFGSARAGWDFLPDYRAELEFVYMSDYFLDPENRHKYDGHELLNLRIIGQLTGRLNFGIRAINLLDTDYAERADYGFGSYRYFVGEPRALYVELGYSLAP